MKILTAMSGGVDSSCAAALLLEQGHEVAGAYMHMHDINNEAAADAHRVADKLGIAFAEIDARDTFEREVLGYFTEAYLQGKTPNPCIRCNRTVKFGFFLDYALSHGYDAIATGHYAKLTRGDDGYYRLIRSANRDKDQSYFLYHLTQSQMSRCLFPLEDADKMTVREKARDLELAVAEKKDSQDICFVEDGKYAEFIEEYCGTKSEGGAFVDIDGNEIGRHQGIIRYTIGQRKGVNTAFGKRLYVIGKNISDNTVTMGDDELLFTDTLTAGDVYINEAYRDKLMSAPLTVTAAHRYNQRDTGAVVRVTESAGAFVKRISVTFDKKQRAVTKGQAVVLYDGDIVVGGGEIE